MKCKTLVVFLFSSFMSLNAMQQDLSNFEDCSVTFQIQVPSPARETPEKKIDLESEDAVVEYLSTLKNPSEIPSSMYDIIIREASRDDISEAFSNVLLIIWGINPDILVSGKKEIIESIRATLLEVKNAQHKK